MDLRDYTSGDDLREELFNRSEFEDWMAGSGTLWVSLDGLDEGIENYRAMITHLLVDFGSYPLIASSFE